MYVYDDECKSAAEFWNPEMAGPHESINIVLADGETAISNHVAVFSAARIMFLSLWDQYNQLKGENAADLAATEDGK